MPYGNEIAVEKEQAPSPRGTPAPGPSPTPADDKEKAAQGYPKTHVIEKGDTYWALAKAYYDNASSSLIPSLAAHIQKANAGVQMRPGKKLTIPAPPEGLIVNATAKSNEGEVTRPTVPPSRGDGRSEKAQRPRDTPTPPAVASVPRDYVVQAGDTLMKIAMKFYGDAMLFHLIEDANGSLKYEMLRAGSKIRIPAKK